MTFRTVNGKTFFSRRTEPVLPKNATRKERAQFKQRALINNCIKILQEQYEDIREAIAMRSTIQNRLRKLYPRYAATIKAPTKLQRAIMTEYYARYGFEKGPTLHRENIGNGSAKSGQENSPE